MNDLPSVLVCRKIFCLQMSFKKCTVIIYFGLVGFFVNVFYLFGQSAQKYSDSLSVMYTSTLKLKKQFILMFLLLSTIIHSDSDLSTSVKKLL